MLAVSAGYRDGPVARGPHRDKAHGLVADVAVNVGINHILRRRGELGKRLLELLPVLDRVQVEEGNADAARIEDHPLERDLAGFAREQVGNDRAMPGKHYIES